MCIPLGIFWHCKFDNNIHNKVASHIQNIALYQPSAGLEVQVIQCIGIVLHVLSNKHITPSCSSKKAFFESEIP